MSICMTRWEGTLVLQAFELGLIHPCHPPLALGMPVGVQRAALPPAMPRRVRDAQGPLQVRQPPLVGRQRGTAPSTGVMDLEAPHQLYHRLAAEGLGLFGRAEPLLGQPFRELAGGLSCVRQVPDRRTQPRVAAHVFDAADRAGYHPCGRPASDPFHGDLQAFG